jgi:hypothetical protein
MNEEIIYLNKKTFIESIDIYRRKTFKILPIYEGREKGTGLIVHSEEVAHEIYKRYLSSFSIELKGFHMQENSFDFEIPKTAMSLFRDVICSIDGLKEVGIGEHQTVKSMVFRTMSVFDNIEKLVK